MRENHDTRPDPLVTWSPDDVRAAYPQAFSVLRVVDGPPREANWPELLRAWWNDPVTDQVKRLYEEPADQRRR